VNAERPVLAVGVVVIDEGRILLIKRGAAIEHGKWAIPGGKVNYGETLRAAAAREVLEETGLEVEVGAVLWVGETFGEGDPPAHHIGLVDFAGRVVGGELGAADDADDARFVELAEARNFDLPSSMQRLLDALQGSEYPS